MAKLTVHVLNCRNDQGCVMVALYDDPNTFPDPPDPTRLVSASAQISGGCATAVVEDLPEGGWALAAFHDENLNEQLDLGWLKMPKEGFAFGNDAFRMGTPRFDDCSFEVRGDTEHTVHLRYMGLKGLLS